MSQASSSLINQIKKSFQQGKTINGKAILAMIIFGMIILTFVLSDLTGKRAGGGNIGIGAAAEINGDIVTIKELQDQENRISAYYAQLFGGRIDNELQRKQIINQAMTELVNNVVTSQASEKEQIYATDAEIKKIIIEDLPYFKKEGVFQTDYYKNLLAANRLTPGEFEKSLKQQTKNQKIRSLFELTLGASSLEKDLQNELKSKKLKVAYIKLNSDLLKDSASVKSEALTLLSTNPEFQAKVKAQYDLKIADYQTPEQVKASHILIKSDSPSEADFTKAQVKAQSILERLKKEDFGKLASELSDDPGSKAKKGDLGYFSKGRMVKEFEEAAFSLNPGQTSGLVKSSYGYHIIKVADKKAAATQSFDSVKNTLASAVLAEEKATQLSKDFESALAEGKDGSKNEKLEEIIKNSNLKWTESDYFDLSTDQFPGLNSATLFKESLKLTKSAPFSKFLVREGDAQYLLKLVDAKNETPVIASGDKSSESFATDIQRQKSYTVFNKWINFYKESSKISTNNQVLQ